MLQSTLHGLYIILLSYRKYLVNWQARMFGVNMLGKVTLSTKNHATLLAPVCTMHLRTVVFT